MSCTVSSSPYHKVNVKVFPENDERAAFVVLRFSVSPEMWPADFNVVLDSLDQAKELLDALSNALAPRPETE